MMEDQVFGSRARRNIVIAIALAIAALFTGRLVQLQLFEGSKFRLKAEAQGIKQITREPIRGAIYDRYGKPLVVNNPSYAITVIPNKLTPQSRALLARILDTDTATINDRIKKSKTNDYSPVRIWRDLDARTLARLEELHTELTGVDVTDECKRVYVSTARASHLLGYTGEISKDRLEQLVKTTNYYGSGDIIGKSGVEEKWEDQLRGEKGYEYVAVNIRGQRVSSFNDGKDDKSPFNGFDMYLGLDEGLQEYAEQLLKGHRGAVVAIDPNSGEILAMASAPDYDPNVFSGKIDEKAYMALANDPAKPLFNRATQAAYPSGSTWKPLMAIAGLMEGIITPSTTINCPGSFSLGNNVWKCHGAHGAVNVRRAIHVSCNVFFYKLALQLGIDNYAKYGRMFRMGQRSSSDITEGETRLPSREYYDKRYGKDKWPRGVLVNLGIGQGELGVSPMQLANYCATIANGGTWHQPHIVRAIKNTRFGRGLERVVAEVDSLKIPAEIIAVVHQGMYDVVNTPGGTAASARIADIKVAGKTGTAQAGKGKRDHAWFICFAPYESPKISICVLVENSGLGGTYSAPIAKKLIEFYLTRKKDGESVGAGGDNPNGTGGTLGPDENESGAVPADQ